MNDIISLMVKAIVEVGLGLVVECQSVGSEAGTHGRWGQAVRNVPCLCGLLCAVQSPGSGPLCRCIQPHSITASSQSYRVEASVPLIHESRCKSVAYFWLWGILLCVAVRAYSIFLCHWQLLGPMIFV
jgi:hypothetical protein